MGHHETSQNQNPNQEEQASSRAAPWSQRGRGAERSETAGTLGDAREPASAMRFTFFQIPVDDDGRAAERLNAFVANQPTARVERQFIANGDDSLWTFCVTTVEARSIGSPGSPPKGRLDYKEKLAPEDFQVFDQLRRIRKELADREGVPVYGVFTNEQLEQIVLRRVASGEHLSPIAGVGPARVEKFGPAIVSALRASWGGREAPRLTDVAENRHGWPARRGAWGAAHAGRSKAAFGLIGLRDPRGEDRVPGPCAGRARGRASRRPTGQSPGPWYGSRGVRTARLGSDP
jgi:hypothetical protein